MADGRWTYPERLPVAVPTGFRERLANTADGTLSTADSCSQTLMRAPEPSERVVRRKAVGP